MNYAVVILISLAVLAAAGLVFVLCREIKDWLEDRDRNDCGGRVDSKDEVKADIQAILNTAITTDNDCNEILKVDQILAIGELYVFTPEEAQHIKRALQKHYGDNDEWCSVCDSIVGKLEAKK